MGEDALREAAELRCSRTSPRLRRNYSAKVFCSLALSGFELRYLITCLRFLLFFNNGIETGTRALIEISSCR